MNKYYLVIVISCALLSTTVFCQDDSPKPLSNQIVSDNPFGDGKVASGQVETEKTMTFPPEVLGTTPIVIESYRQLDENVDKLVTIKGPMRNTKRAELVGVEVERSKATEIEYDAFAVGILRKFEAKQDQNDSGNAPAASDRPGNVPRYVLFSDLEWNVSIAYPVPKTESQESPN
jgi:hypothetical protein